MNSENPNETFKIDAVHIEACTAKQRTYTDPITGADVFTRYYLVNRGYCCNQGCRHCPYGEMNITIRYKNPSPESL